MIQSGLEIVIIFPIALILDLALGELPTIVHPVGWMGKLASLFIRCLKWHTSWTQFIYGIVVVLATISVFVLTVYYLLFYLKIINTVIYILIAALIFKFSFSLRGLIQAALKIKHLLLKEDLINARFELRTLVGRDIRHLDRSGIVSAVVESLAENLCDSFFSPLFYFILLGVPGAIAYRVINTLDAMIGHHGEFEYLGKFAAHLDTVVNFIPARLTAIVLIIASWLSRESPFCALKIMLRDHGKTESPNAGWTMGVMAGALQVQLEKAGYYKLGDVNQPLSCSTIDASIRLVLISAFLWSLIIILGEGLYHVVT